MTEKELYQQWLEHATEDADLQTELKGIAGDDAAISDRFYRDLEFGTGGLRGGILDRSEMKRRSLAASL